MNRIWALLLLCASACSSEPTGPQATCLAVVNVGGVTYSTTSEPAVAAALVSSEPFVTITRNTGCLDQGQVARELGPGESNFLAVGTTLHSVSGFDPEERLVYWADVVEEWLILSPASS